jgi:predicted dehydrogenase
VRTRTRRPTDRAINERPLPVEGSSGAFQAGEVTQERKTGPVTVDDAAFVLARFENGVLGSFEATRFAPGRRNFNMVEIYGSNGRITFNLKSGSLAQF